MSKRVYHRSWQWNEDDFISALENAEAIASRRLTLLRDIATWYSDTANAHFRYLPIELVERLEKELQEVRRE